MHALTQEQLRTFCLVLVLRMEERGGRHDVHRHVPGLSVRWLNGEEGSNPRSQLCKGEGRRKNACILTAGEWSLTLSRRKQTLIGSSLSTLRHASLAPVPKANAEAGRAVDKSRASLPDLEKEERLSPSFFLLCGFRVTLEKQVHIEELTPLFRHPRALLFFSLFLSPTAFSSFSPSFIWALRLFSLGATKSPCLPEKAGPDSDGAGLLFFVSPSP